MITRMQMPRQMYGLGSFVKDRIRKLIPNELASVASKAAPFVAPFNPGIAGLMRGIGRFDQRGSISDALKQGAATFAFGAGTRALGGADPFGGGLRGGFTSPLSSERTQAIKGLFEKQKVDPSKAKKDTSGILPKKVVEATTGKIPGVRALPKIVQEQLLAGGITAGASVLASYFQGDFREQEPGETMEEYLAARKDVVGKQMRVYMDNYYANDPEYSALDDAGRNAFVARYNVRDGGRIGYQTGGISSANTLAQNIALNRANQAAISKVFQAARDKIAKTKDYAVPVVQGARALLTGAGEPIITDTMRQDLIKRAEAKGGDSGVLGYEDFGLKTSTPGGRFAGGITDIISDPQAFANAATLGRVTFSRNPETGEYSFGDTKYDFNIADTDTGLAANLLRGINEGGLKGAVSNLLTPSKAAAAEPEVTTPTPDASAPAGPRMVDGVSQEGIIPGFVKRRSEFYNADGTPNQEKIKAANFVTGSFPSEFYYERIGEEGGFGPETYASIAAGRYPNIYDPRANVAGGGMPTGIMRSNQAGVMERDYRDEGGFVPVGIKEKADDVPAMLSKNEFVFTADAVRGAGNGSIEKGAQKMYDTMKNLERRVV